jgi:hypothetical protein
MRDVMNVAIFKTWNDVAEAAEKIELKDYQDCEILEISASEYVLMVRDSKTGKIIGMIK